MSDTKTTETNKASGPVLAVKTQIRAGKLAGNHNQALAVRTMLRAGKLATNHNQALAIR